MRRSITLTLAALAGLAAPAMADTIRVPQDHGTIQEAVDAASPGDTIEVSPGKYDESVEVNTSGLVLIGKGNPEIRPGSVENGIHVFDANDVTVSGFKIRGGQWGVLVERCDGIVITKVQVANSDEDGIAAWDSSDVEVSKCRIDAPGLDGVAFGKVDPGSGEVSDPVDGGKIEKVRVRRAGDQGFSIVGNDVTVLKCRSDDSDNDGFDVRGEESTDVTFEKCIVSRSDDEGFATNAPRTTFIKCSAKRVREECFDIEGDEAEAIKCKGQSARRAFEIDHAVGVTLLQCKGSKTDEAVFYLGEATGCTVDGCKATKAGTHGFHLTSNADNNVLRRNKASNSPEFDLLDDSGNNDIDDSNKFKTVEID